MDRGDWQARVYGTAVHGVTKSWTRLSDCHFGGFPGGLDGKQSDCNAEDSGSIPGSGRCPGEGNGNPLQYSCLENSMDRGAWQLQPIDRVTELDTTE